ncbi:4-hydroxybenzoate solanesyltransferase [Sphaerospermopsis kisseleviana CS-549]|uniref:4-hydroxybenzoate solanesyltransferase n=1 Tax=Sphaerospermopsis kisseleviana CS-549 TaxID=3021783 RepID=A0ABT4ZNR9_9CYAN|nr:MULTISPECIES: 4-hydroxybenzoate solanesyltransferase [Sphaerospermopsis]MBD2133442.1 4-hydroxybenzoate solanesyltransferase [Sphaerospermopsis sp. FACHB-1094]MBD2144853.1 4-hydroxybenzoate solanesyltransferase [Sphaerospermopsis sp. FACHB-1194]MDB9441046.1 4-hydroxybenzoate solanesyltransferase [Sphaerospermopsis kisseleviana CS-549]BAZ82839.1 4-hydroxybenzoate polyprenyl transferase [Sphaerospermopsis kisseleviana NIES-73]
MLTTPESNQEPLWLVIIRLLRWHKPEGRLILMIPALWAVFLAAAGKPPLPLVGVIILGTLATSAAGCVVNDLWDRDIDPQVERTRDRPLASRALSIKVGIAVGIVALACAAVLAFYLSPLSFWLSVAAVPVILLYPGAKRVFPVPQLVLSIAWGFAVLISWSAVTQNITAPTWLLWGATVLWTLGFDTIYAMSDRQDDQRIGVNSSALFFGKYAPTAIGIFFAGTIILLAGEGLLVNLNGFFWISLIIASGGWVWQFIRLRNPELPNPAYGEMFRQNVWIGFLILAGMIFGSF